MRGMTLGRASKHLSDVGEAVALFVFASAAAAAALFRFHVGDGQHPCLLSRWWLLPLGHLLLHLILHATYNSA